MLPHLNPGAVALKAELIQLLAQRIYTPQMLLTPEALHDRRPFTEEQHKQLAKRRISSGRRGAWLGLPQVSPLVDVLALRRSLHAEGSEQEHGAIGHRARG